MTLTPDQAMQQRAEAIVAIVRDPRQWGAGREFEIRDIFEVWAWASIHEQTAILAAIARVVATQHLFRRGREGAEVWAERFKAQAAQAKAAEDWPVYADWLEGLLVLTPPEDKPAQRRLLEELSMLYAQAGQTQRRCWHLNRLAGLYQRLAEPQLARQTALESYRLSRGIGDDLGVGLAAIALADVLEGQGRVRDAGRLLYAAWHALREAGSLFGITARDTLRTLQHEHGIAEADVATEVPLDDMLATLLGET